MDLVGLLPGGGGGPQTAGTSPLLAGDRPVLALDKKMGLGVQAEAVTATLSLLAFGVSKGLGCSGWLLGVVPLGAVSWSLPSSTFSQVGSQAPLGNCGH